MLDPTHVIDTDLRLRLPIESLAKTKNLKVRVRPGGDPQTGTAAGTGTFVAVAIEGHCQIPCQRHFANMSRTYEQVGMRDTIVLDAVLEQKKSPLLTYGSPHICLKP